MRDGKRTNTASKLNGNTARACLPFFSFLVKYRNRSMPWRWNTSRVSIAMETDQALKKTEAQPRVSHVLGSYTCGKFTGIRRRRLSCTLSDCKRSKSITKKTVYLNIIWRLSLLTNGTQWCCFRAFPSLRLKSTSVL